MFACGARSRRGAVEGRPARGANATGSGLEGAAQRGAAVGPAMCKVSLRRARRLELMEVPYTQYYPHKVRCGTVHPYSSVSTRENTVWWVAKVEPVRFIMHCMQAESCCLQSSSPRNGEVEMLGVSAYPMAREDVCG